MIIADPAGNQSKPSDPWVVIVDTTHRMRRPLAASMTTWATKPGTATGDVTDDTTPTLKGQAEAGAKVEIYDRGQKIGEVTTGPDGNWAFTPDSELAEGEHSFTVRATDAAGNASELSQPWELVIDITHRTSRVQTAMPRYQRNLRRPGDNTGADPQRREH
ncbi:Uncharacterised protein [Serratia fonticola]|uniref:Bacterial Ig-like domain-containing protein n=1 Tax=Serratia fonticola TaxID=47917 RepID=A0A4U9UJL6_SERFO|nr:Uncharacterised protein [Serratia fonticola]